MKPAPHTAPSAFTHSHTYLGGSSGMVLSTPFSVMHVPAWSYSGVTPGGGTARTNCAIRRRRKSALTNA
eukprot:13847386-Alexandrium_andersonii.AAC.1